MTRGASRARAYGAVPPRRQHCEYWRDMYLATDEGIGCAQAIHIEHATTSQAKKAGNLGPMAPVHLLTRRSLAPFMATARRPRPSTNPPRRGKTADLDHQRIIVPDGKKQLISISADDGWVPVKVSMRLAHPTTVISS